MTESDSPQFVDERHRAHVNRLHTVAQALVDKLDKMGASKDFEGVFTWAFVHGYVYKGENWSKELEELRKVLQEIK